MDIYVDGSFNKNTGYYGWAFAVYKNNNLLHSDCGSNNKASSIWNVAGELSATMNAVSYAYDKGMKHINLYHDYEGVAKWATNKWKAKNIYTQKYVKFMEYYKDKLSIKFIHVKGHSGIEGNEFVDRLSHDSCFWRKEKK